jgi:glycosyltransferase involved in cell wall biosynthesis
MSHIVIDARHLNLSTGVYMQNLLKELDKAIDDSMRITALVPSGETKRLSTELKNISLVPADQKWYSVAEQFSLAILLYRLKPDLVHFCMPQQPLLYFGKRITTVHDLTLIRFDNIDINQYVYKFRKFVFKTLLKAVIRRSAKILVPTNYVREDILDFSSTKYKEKIYITPEAGDPLSGTPEPVAKLKDKTFIFFVGNAFPYKNLYRIVDSYALAKKDNPELQLVFAGKKDYFYDQIEGYVREKGIDDVRILGFVSEGEKRWLMQHAVAYVVASLSEGFHIPGLEAMYEDCPVISSNATCLPEVYEDAALYFDPHSTTDLASCISLLMNDPDKRKQMAKLGNAQVKKYSWGKTAQLTLEAYRQVLPKA